MRNLIYFIRRFFNFILFVVLEIICITLIARNRNMMQGNEILNSANAVAGYFYKKQNDITYYFHLKEANDSLLNENKRLHEMLAAKSSVDTLRDSTAKVGIPVQKDSVHYVQYAMYTYRSARVINNSVNATNNFITINRGSAEGISRDMAVISGTGIVGKVVNVSAHFATVRSILGVNQRVSAKLKDGTYSFVSWEGGNPDVLFMKNIPAEIKVKKGDSVFTTSFSTLFPPNLLVGTVFRIDIQKKDNTQQLFLRSATNFRSLQYVYVIEDKMLDERIKLEDSTKNKK